MLFSLEGAKLQKLDLGIVRECLFIGRALGLGVVLNEKRTQNELRPLTQ